MHLGDSSDIRNTNKETERYRETLPAIVLDNTVTWVNPSFDKRLPLDIEKGTRSKLALFFHDGQPEPDFSLGVSARNWRSGDLGKIFFADNKQRLYRDLDLKGCGLLSYVYPPPQPPNRSADRIVRRDWHADLHGGNYLGLLDEKSAEEDSRMAEVLTDIGVRTHRSIAIFELKELPVPYEGGRRLATIHELIKTGAMTETFKPVIQLRAFGIKKRLDGIDKDLGKSELDDALSFVRAEIPAVSDPISYLKWFAETMGKNLGRMHGAGYSHGNLSLQNMTLDCRITDFDTVRPKNPERIDAWHTRVRRDACRDGVLASIPHLAAVIHTHYGNQVGHVEDDELYEKYMDSYELHSGLPFPM